MDASNDCVCWNYVYLQCFHLSRAFSMVFQSISEKNGSKCEECNFLNVEVQTWRVCRRNHGLKVTSSRDIHVLVFCQINFNSFQFSQLFHGYQWNMARCERYTRGWHIIPQTSFFLGEKIHFTCNWKQGFPVHFSVQTYEIHVEVWIVGNFKWKVFKICELWILVEWKYQIFVVDIFSQITTMADLVLWFCHQTIYLSEWKFIVIANGELASQNLKNMRLGDLNIDLWETNSQPSNTLTVNLQQTHKWSRITGLSRCSCHEMCYVGF